MHKVKKKYREMHKFAKKFSTSRICIANIHIIRTYTAKNSLTKLKLLYSIKLINVKSIEKKSTHGIGQQRALFGERSGL